MKKRLCASCDHEVGRHSHMNWHECKVDGCDCPAYARKALANVRLEDA